MKKFGSFITSNRNLVIALAVLLGVTGSIVIGWQVSATGTSRDNSKISTSQPAAKTSDLPSGVDPANQDAAATSAQHGTQDQVRGVYRGVITAERFDISPPLSSLVNEMRGFPVKEERERDEFEDRPTGLEGPFGPQDIDQVVESALSPLVMPTPSVSFNSTITCGGGCAPPDPVGDVGPNHYVAMGNVQFQIFNKAGASLLGPSNINTLWAGFGGACQTENAGDPVVIYDQLDDRWILTQFTAAGPTYFNCVAISTTPNPTGTYFRYAFSTGTNFPDYPKYGMWRDALYISTREFAGAPFAGVGAYAVNRAQLVAGNPAAQLISMLAPPGGTAFNVGDGLLPTDLDGSTLPPVGAPNYFIGSMDNGGPYGAPSDNLTLWKFHADFVTPASSTFTLANTIPIAAYDTIFPCTPSARECIPQSGTAVKIDHLGYRQRPLHRAAYRNFGTHESIVTNQSVEATGAISGIRWWEIRSPNSAPSIFQEGTYAPGDGIHRWMGSIAMDRNGNMALGYSASNGTIFPSVRYTGRLAADPAGTLPQGEAATIAGTGSQTTANRWGDYTSMNIDSTDDCTFWYINEWVPVTGGAWQLRIGAFKFPTCVAATPTATSTPTNTATATNTATPAITPLPAGLCNENFDSVTAPALPTGWTSAATGSEVAWVTSTTTPDTAPNDAFAPDPAGVGNTELFSPSLNVPGSGGSFSFRNNYITEANFDGMVLEISINGGAFADIITAGGAFVTGGYNGTISVNFMSPIAGRMAWTGNSAGYITTTVNLPASANGQNIQLKWRMATDNSVAATGVRIDTITGIPCPCTSGEVWDNGPLVTDPTGGFGGAPVSALQQGLGLTTFGFGAQTTTTNRLADDFTVPAGGSTINTVTLYGYQTGSTTTSTFNDARVQIWNGPPNVGGSAVVFGDTTTNRFVSTVFTGIYRAADTTPTTSNRPIMSVVANVGTTLPAGTYWIDFQLGGTLVSGPFVPAVTILGQVNKPGSNALQFTSAWALALDGANVQDVPFKINGTGGCPPTTSISGTITYGNAIGSPAPPRFVKNVSVASVSGTPSVGPVITGTPGTYTLTGFGAGGYTIKPTKPGGPNGAITSNDAARVAQGVTGSLPFVSQNQRFTADSTGNGAVSSQDAAKIAQFVAGLPTVPPNLTGAWRFFVTGAPSPLPTAPQTYNDSRTYASVVGNFTGEDYVALLVGEASGNWNPATHPRPVAGPERSVSVGLPNLMMPLERELIVPVSVQGVAGKEVISYEFDLRYDPLVIQPSADAVDVAGTVSRGLSVVVNATEPGLLRVMMYGAYPIDSDGVLLNLRFVAVGKAGSVSPISFERIMFNEGESGVTATDGQIELTESKES